MRIAQYLARCGVASRRKSEELVSAGRVTVNGETVLDLGRQVSPGEDDVRLDGVPLRLRAQHLTLAFNKPPNVVVSRGDTHGRTTVYDLLPPEYAAEADRLVYVGRLDYPSEGLLIMTTDGDLANTLAHPSHHAEKEYHVWTNRPLTPYELGRLQKGIELDDGVASAAAAGPLPGGDGYRVVLTEGRKRQVRRMIEAVGARVTRLVRVRIGGFSIGNLGPGCWKVVSESEREQLLSRKFNKRVDRDKPPARKPPE